MWITININRLKLPTIQVITMRRGCSVCRLRILRVMVIMRRYMAITPILIRIKVINSQCREILITSARVSVEIRCKQIPTPIISSQQPRTAKTNSKSSTHLLCRIQNATTSTIRPYPQNNSCTNRIFIWKMW